MAFIPRVAACDCCGIPKGRTNHWFCIRVHAGEIVTTPFSDKARGVMHACGESCAGKLIARALPGLHASVPPVQEPEPITFPLLEKLPPDQRIEFAERMNNLAPEEISAMRLKKNEASA